MPRKAQTIVAQLFKGATPAERTRNFSWRLIQRRHHPFLLVPTAPANPRVSLALYSAQRQRAKLWRALLPLLLNTPAAALFHRVTFAVGDDSEVIRFLSVQSGVPVHLLPPPAIKFGGLVGYKSRLVLLLCDGTDRPVKVIKLGLDAAGRAATDREVELLEKLPANGLGCVRATGRLITPQVSAFATDYFAGASPENDLGLEILFHSWLNATPPVPVETLDVWRELDTAAAGAVPALWQGLRPALAGQTIRTTLHHGDFTPWNIRAVNSQRLQVFDWERGRLHGIPGWDWFHFVVQTAVLVRRHSVERVAAEFEELLQSPRFQAYARAAGIQPIVRPLALAYLIHHCWVVKPVDGASQIEKLLQLLSARWGFSAQLGRTGARTPAATSAAGAPPTLWADVSAQLKSARSQLANVFWEPDLIAPARVPFSQQLKSAWLLLLFCLAWLAATAALQFHTTHLLLLPLYAVPCLLAGWRISRGWGTCFAGIGAVAGPLIGTVKTPDTHTLDVNCWNILMRFLTLQICVFLVNRINIAEDFFDELVTPARRKADFRRNWAVFAFSAAWFLIIAWGDLATGPRVSFLPLYLFPAMLVTLFLNLRWGALTVLFGALVASLDEYVSKYDASLLKVFAWNFPMRFLMLFLVIALLNRLRYDNVLFNSAEPRGHSPSNHPA